ncbi:glycosyltransferase family 4 protein [Lentibacter sp.]|uniref:glycosyltransferase family 4 protein n=1 Tax=Lentibacter sp. TaxID=2024994 RepID=UPI003F6955A0
MTAQSPRTELIVTNFNKNFTGVSATAAAVLRQQMQQYDLALAGQALPHGPDPITKRAAFKLSRRAPDGRPFVIWHVRRNPEMRAALWARDVLRLPVRIVFTSAAQRRHSAYPRWLISRMDAIIATTEAAATYVPNVRAVVPHGVDTDVFTPAQNRALAWERLGYGGKTGIASIGRVRPEKGTDRFVQAMLRLLPDHPDMTALVIGRASSAHATFLNGLKEQTAKAGLSDRLLFTGEIPAAEMPKLMRGLSAVVQLPRYEGYGMTPLEGMASGVPFVATDAGSYRAFSRDGQTGTIVPEDAPEDTADALNALLADPERLVAQAEAARKAAVELFSIKAEAQGIAKVYDSLWQAQA